MRLGQIRRTGTLLLFAALACEVQSQTTTSGALAGVVVDQSNAVISNADVTLRDNAKGTVQSTRTDDEGVYRFLFLAPGSYTLSVAHAGFQEQTRTVSVPLGPSISVDMVLSLQKLKTDIVVTDETSSVKAENGDVSASMNQTQVAELPNPGNDLTYVVQTAPGVVMNTDVQGLANFSILGMPGFSYLHTMDGMNDNDNGVNLSMVGPLILLLGQNQVQETTLVTTGYSGQFGGAAGGDINYVTKSGGNALHGNAQYYWNGRALNANNWFNNAFVQPRPFSIANQWAGSLSGPIRKNKLFFFLDTEGLRLLIPPTRHRRFFTGRCSIFITEHQAPPPPRWVDLIKKMIVSGVPDLRDPMGWVPVSTPVPDTSSVIAAGQARIRSFPNGPTGILAQATAPFCECNMIEGAVSRV